MSATGFSKTTDGALSDRIQSLTKVGAAGFGTGSGVQKLENLTGIGPVGRVVEGSEELLEPSIQDVAIRIGLHCPDQGFYFFRPHDAVLLCSYEQEYCNTYCEYEKSPFWGLFFVIGFRT